MRTRMILFVYIVACACLCWFFRIPLAMVGASLLYPCALIGVGLCTWGTVVSFERIGAFPLLGATILLGIIVVWISYASSFLTSWGDYLFFAPFIFLTIARVRENVLSFLHRTKDALEEMPHWVVHALDLIFIIRLAFTLEPTPGEGPILLPSQETLGGASY